MHFVNDITPAEILSQQVNRVVDAFSERASEICGPVLAVTFKGKTHLRASAHVSPHVGENVELTPWGALRELSGCCLLHSPGIAEAGEVGEFLLIASEARELLQEPEFSFQAWVVATRIRLANFLQDNVHFTLPSLQGLTIKTAREIMNLLSTYIASFPVKYPDIPSSESVFVLLNTSPWHSMIEDIKRHPALAGWEEYDFLTLWEHYKVAEKDGVYGLIIPHNYTIALTTGAITLNNTPVNVDVFLDTVYVLMKDGLSLEDASRTVLAL